MANEELVVEFRKETTPSNSRPGRGRESRQSCFHGLGPPPAPTLDVAHCRLSSPDGVLQRGNGGAIAVRDDVPIHSVTAFAFACMVGVCRERGKPHRRREDTNERHAGAERLGQRRRCKLLGHLHPHTSSYTYTEQLFLSVWRACPPGSVPLVPILPDTATHPRERRRTHPLPPGR